MGFVGSNQVVEASYDFSVVDSNNLPFLFKHAPEVAKELDVGSDFSLVAADLSPRQTFMVLSLIKTEKYVSLLRFEFQIGVIFVSHVYYLDELIFVQSAGTFSSIVFVLRKLKVLSKK